MNRQSQLRRRKCGAEACGAYVVLLSVGGVEMAVNPDPVPVVVEEAGRGWRETTGYQPHWATCVDISGRLRRKEGLLRRHGVLPRGGPGA